MTPEEFLGHLEKVRRTGNGWLACCPAHDDRRQSLSIGQGETAILLKCFAGCSTRDIVASLGLSERDLFPDETASPKVRNAQRTSNSPEAIYPYRNQGGELLYEVLRFQGKKFIQRRPDGKGGWIYDLRGARRVLYRLPELQRADKRRVVFIPEGEKDVESLVRLGEIATTNQGGASGTKLWEQAEFRDALHGRSVVILPDNDEPGRRHAERLAQILFAAVSSVKVLALPGLSDKGDISDWIAGGGTREKLAALVDAAPGWTPARASQSADHKGSASGARKGPCQARLLVAIAQDHAELFKTSAGDGYATTKDGETMLIRSKAFRRFLLGKFFQAHDKAASAQALTEAVDTLDTLAALGNVLRTVALRVGTDRGRLYLDLGTSDRGIVEIAPTGWGLVCPGTVDIRFRRTAIMRALPCPSRPGNVEALRRFLNIGAEEWRWRLLLAWLLFAFQPAGPFPVLVLQGEQGCAKSTTARVSRALVDPSQAPLRLPPRDEDKLIVSAKSSWVLAFDNLSGMPTWLSDCLCCLATGTAQSKRALYTDDEEHIIEATRPVIVNGIDDMTARPDFASRALAIDLPQIKDERRQEEATFWAEFEAVQPDILGGLLSTVAQILAIRNELALPSKPRMADFARFGVAAERVLSTAV